MTRSSSTRVRVAQPPLALWLFAIVLALPLAGTTGAASESVSVAGHYWGITGPVLSEGTDTPALEALVGDLGVTHFRPTIRWSDVQPSASSPYDWTESDALFDAYREHGARALVLLNSGSAPWATDQSWMSMDTEPSTDFPPRILPALDEPIEGDEPYYVFVREAVARYHDVAAAWLIDNEPSEPWTWAGDADSYARMARLAAAAVHEADPDATVAFGAIPAGTVAAMAIADRLDDATQEEFVATFASRMWGYPLTMEAIRTIFDTPSFRVWDRVNFFRQALGVLPEMDALAGNVLGRHARGEVAQDLVWAYEDQMQTYGGVNRPLIYSEMNTYLADETALAQETTQLMIASLATGKLLGQAYHGFVDDTVERIDEPACGLVTKTLELKQGYYAYRTLISLLGDATEAASFELPGPASAYRFRDEAGLTVFALWAPEAVELDLREVVGPSSAALVDMVGDPLDTSLDHLPVGPSPTYAIVAPPGMSDIPWGHWAFDAILACIRNGVVVGYPGGEFRPALPVTRAQMAVFLARALAGSDAAVPPGPAEPSFLDVYSDYWAFRHVEYLRALGVSTGYPDRLYRPETPVDRAQMAVFIARSMAGESLTEEEQPAAPSFTDVTPENEWSWCYQQVKYLVSQGIVSGYPDGLYHPDDPCTRDQMAVYIARAFAFAG